MIVTIEKDKDGLYFILPDSIIEEYGLEVGDDAHFSSTDDYKTIEIYFTKGKKDGIT